MKEFTEKRNKEVTKSVLGSEKTHSLNETFLINGDACATNDVRFWSSSSTAKNPLFLGFICPDTFCTNCDQNKIDWMWHKPIAIYSFN